jgi:hypothetical protein
MFVKIGAILRSSRRFDSSMSYSDQAWPNSYEISPFLEYVLEILTFEVIHSLFTMIWE